MSVHELQNVSTEDVAVNDADIWQLRVDLAAACRLAALYRWDDQLATHISVRIPGENHRFFINPLGLFFEEVTASSVLEIDENGHASSGAPVNLAGFLVHSALHMNREDAKAVIHLHTTAGIAVGASQRGLRNLSTFSMILDPVSYHEWEGVVLGPDERERLASDMGASAVMLLRNHGSLTVGESMGAAFLRMYFLQRACEVQISADTLGDELIEHPFEMSSARATEPSCPELFCDDTH